MNIMPVLHYVVENIFRIMSNVFHNSGLRRKEKNGGAPIAEKADYFWTVGIYFHIIRRSRHFPFCLMLICLGFIDSCGTIILDVCLANLAFFSVRYTTSASPALAWIINCSSVKFLMEMAFSGHTEAHAPHPLHEAPMTCISVSFS